jgi:hypothetical protein
MIVDCGARVALLTMYLVLCTPELSEEELLELFLSKSDSGGLTVNYETPKKKVKKV